MLQSVDVVNALAHHHCDSCGAQRGVAFNTIQIDANNLTIGPCPGCYAQGKTVTEHFRLDLTRADTGEIQHPQSMVGTVFADTGGVVVEDSRFESPHHRKQQALLIRQLMAALNLPLAPDPQAKHP